MELVIKYDEVWFVLSHSEYRLNILTLFHKTGLCHIIFLYWLSDFLDLQTKYHWRRFASECLECSDGCQLTMSTRHFYGTAVFTLWPQNVIYTLRRGCATGWGVRADQFLSGASRHYCGDQRVTSLIMGWVSLGLHGRPNILFVIEYDWTGLSLFVNLRTHHATY